VRASGEEDDVRSVVLDQSFPSTDAVVHTMIHADQRVRVRKSHLPLAVLREIVPNDKVDVVQEHAACDSGVAQEQKRVFAKHAAELLGVPLQQATLVRYPRVDILKIKALAEAGVTDCVHEVVGAALLRHIENINRVPPFRLGLEKRGVGLLRHLEAAAVLIIVQIHVRVLAPAPLAPIPPSAGRARGERSSRTHIQSLCS
jgi:hypothetical protein